MYFHTLTSIGAGSTGASGGTSACANCTMAGGGCISIVRFPVLLAVYQVLPRRGAGKTNFSGHFAAAIRQPMAIGFAGSESTKTRKRGTRLQVPLHQLFVGRLRS